MAIVSQKLLNRLYPDAGKPPPQPAPKSKSKPLWVQVESWARNLNVFGVIALLALTFWLYGVIYYYNALLSARAKANGEWANSLVVMQERHHIIINLTRVVIDYAKHERDVLTTLTELRTGPKSADRDAAAAALALEAKKGAPGETKTAKPVEDSGPRALAAQLQQPVQIDKLTPKQLEALFSRIQLVAEQYPQLKLNENFKQFSDHIVETEHKLAEHLMAYNNAANAYGNVMSLFPGNHYAWMFGFKRMEFYQVEPAELVFKEIEY